MKGDFTRDTFDARKHFSRVLMQQGRVQLDADFNEQASILLHYMQTLAADLIGSYGGPHLGSGFLIGNVANGDVSIGAGRYYVDGILCENEQAALTYRTQDGFAPDKLNSDTPYFVYLDVWERHILPAQDGSIRESALGGPDTCTRAKVVWQVKTHALPVGATNKERERAAPQKDITDLEAQLKAETDPTKQKDLKTRLDAARQTLAALNAIAADCVGADTWIRGLSGLSSGTLTAHVKPEGPITDACSLPPESRYRGLENQLYRVEVHRGNVDAEGKIVPKAKPTFKWSRDNGAVVFPIASEKGDTVTLQSLGRDAQSSLQHGDWVEIVDDATDLRGEPGVLAQVDAVDSMAMTVKLSQPYVVSPAMPTWPGYTDNDPVHPMLRLWNQQEVEGQSLDQGALPVDTNGGDWIALEGGVEVKLAQVKDDGSVTYRTGDYWLIPARVATGEIEWLGQPTQEARGIRHHYAPLAVLAGGTGTATSCRTCFSLASNECA